MFEAPELLLYLPMHAAACIDGSDKVCLLVVLFPCITLLCAPDPSPLQLLVSLPVHAAACAKALTASFCLQCCSPLWCVLMKRTWPQSLHHAALGELTELVLAGVLEPCAGLGLALCANTM